MHKGYNSELECKKKLIAEFGEHNVFKIAIGGAVDFIVVGKGELVKCIEVKECHGKKYYSLPQEKLQFQRILDFCDEHQITCELWIKYPNRGWEINDLKEYMKSKELNK